MPSFSDSIFLFILALLLFGPKRLPALARELGKWVGEFRRASNEFKMQMDEEMRASEQADRQKQIAAMEAAAPVTPAIEEPEHPHMPALDVTQDEALAGLEPVGPSVTPVAVAPLPIATSGELNMMPPATGLPVARGSNGSASNNGHALGGLIEAIPEAPGGVPVETPPAERPLTEIEQQARENALHGD